MAKAPRVWYQVVYREEATGSGKLSLQFPYDKCTVNFSSNVHIKQFLARATKGNEEWGIDKGVLIAEINNRDANTQLSFDIITANHLTDGDGEYRIGLYLQNDDDLWNLDEMFIVTNNNGSKFITDNRTTLFYSGMSQKLYQMNITLNGASQIDLSLLKGLSDTKVVWGDGTTTHKGLTHTYSQAGTYTIQANFTDVVTIDSYFMNNNTQLTAIDFTNLPNVTKINNAFLKGCSNLTSITTTNFDKVQSVGDDFLCGCSNLTTFNFATFSACNKVGSGFLYNCSSLTAVDLTNFNCVSDTSIGNLFLYGCSSITTLNLNKLNTLTTIPNNFLNECTGLLSVDISGYANLTTIGNNFLAGCTGLTTMNISNNSLLRSIGSQFLNRCSNITTIYCPVPARWQDIPALGSWGSDLTGLTKIIVGDMKFYYKNISVWQDKADLMRETA